MKHIRIIPILVAMLISLATYADSMKGGIMPTPVTAYPVLNFRPDGTFKIVQLTDIHWRPEEVYEMEVNYNKMIGDILEIEKPDLVVITGDILFRHGKVNYDLQKAIAPIVQRHIPWAFIMGNHDYEYGENGANLVAFMSKQPYSLTQPGPEDLGSAGNYILKIFSPKTQKVGALLYMIDSHGNDAPVELKGTDGSYDWIHLNQIEWYKNQSSQYTKANGSTPIPSLMFFHIPIPEFKEVWDKGIVTGTKIEGVACPKVNSGMFTAILECQDVSGVFVGHDHVNDYVGYLYGITLAYGRKTGLACYGPAPLENGARVILMHEGVQSFDTWVRTKSGKQENSLKSPEYFLPQ
ncbi:MAG: metallophosphoesterase family protein [Lentisphaerota bacterium]